MKNIATKSTFYDKVVIQARNLLGKGKASEERKSEATQARSYTATDADFLSMFSPSFMRSNYDITFYQAVVYYCHVLPIATGIDCIIDEIESFKTILTDIEDKKTVKTDDGILKLFRHPNADVCGGEFMKQLAGYFKITGNAYIMATGDFPKPVLELSCIQPQRVTMSPHADGYVDAYNVNLGNAGSRIFKRKEIGGRFRFFDALGNELWHIRAFNPRFSPSQLYGLSDLNACYYEIEQHLQGNKHNLALLNNGGRPSGALICTEELSTDQRARLKVEMANDHLGAENAGRPYLFDGGHFSWSPFGETPRDMDFQSNRSAVATAIFSRLKVPLPLVTGEAMSYSNFKEARLSLYDNAVFPLANKIYAELTDMLAPRYKLGNMVLTYDENAISALEPRKSDIIAQKAKSGVLTINEVRTLYGYESIDGGDTLYQPMSMIPLGLDRYTEDNLKKPTKMTDDEARLLLKRHGFNTIQIEAAMKMHRM